MARSRVIHGDGPVQEQGSNQGSVPNDSNQRQLPQVPAEKENHTNDSRHDARDGPRIITNCNSEHEQDEDQEEQSKVNMRLQEDRNATDEATAKFRGSSMEGIGRDVDSVTQPENGMEPTPGVSPPLIPREHILQKTIPSRMKTKRMRRRTVEAMTK